MDCRLGFIVDFLSHATIVGFMAGAATVVCLQQLKGILGLDHFTNATDVVSVMRSVFSQTHEVDCLVPFLPFLSHTKLIKQLFSVFFFFGLISSKHLSPSQVIHQNCLFFMFNLSHQSCFGKKNLLRTYATLNSC